MTLVVVAHYEVDNVVVDLVSYSYVDSMDVEVINDMPHYHVKQASSGRKRTSKTMDYVDFTPNPAVSSVNVLMVEMDFFDGISLINEDYYESDSGNVISILNERVVDSFFPNYYVSNLNCMVHVENGNDVSTYSNIAHAMPSEVLNDLDASVVD